jgi:cytochrome c-type biogenesis protein CcmF
VLPRLGLALGAGLVPASLAPLLGRALRRTPLAIWGMCLAHLGVAVALIGMASDSAFTREKLTTAMPGDRIAVGPWLVEMRSINPVAGPNWTALEAELRASKGAGLTILKPQSRFFTEPATTTSEAAIETDWNGQLYAVLGAEDVATGRWQVRLWWKPFVTLIWLGGVLIALGGLLALIGRWWRAFRTRRRFVEAEW